MSDCSCAGLVIGGIFGGYDESSEQRTKRINCWSGVCVVALVWRNRRSEWPAPHEKDGYGFFDAQGKDEEYAGTRCKR
ncbi:hypothetical protein P7H22_10695 [Paenibacillus larvae]|nr:hypothetical protein [Paenibacillus larvae]MDT2240711.1 hypothetical protein [Paenibacillus larvae]